MSEQPNANNEIEEIKENAIDIEKTEHGFKIKGKFWTFILIIVSLTACAIALKKFGVI